jgi:crossover junction endodeoxyribonuclease RusA
MILVLPIPPSTNKLYANLEKGGRTKTAKYKAWLKQADQYLLAQKRGLIKVSGALEIKVMLPSSMRGDCSNRIKAAEDYLVSREITPDDRHNVKVSAERDATVEPGTCRIMVEAVE